MSRSAAVYTLNNDEGQPESWVDTRRLSREARELLARGMKILAPEKVDLLKNDAGVDQLKARFGARLQLPLEEYRRYIEVAKAEVHADSDQEATDASN